MHQVPSGLQLEELAVAQNEVIVFVDPSVTQVDVLPFTIDDEVITAEFTTFLWRSQGKPGAGTSNPFTDVAENTYYTDAVLWAAENGITEGTSDTTFSPDEDCIRAQTVTFLYRCLGR